MFIHFRNSVMPPQREQTNVQVKPSEEPPPFSATSAIIAPAISLSTSSIPRFPQGPIAIDCGRCRLSLFSFSFFFNYLFRFLHVHISLDIHPRNSRRSRREKGSSSSGLAKGKWDGYPSRPVSRSARCSLISVYRRLLRQDLLAKGVSAWTHTAASY